MERRRRAALAPPLAAVGAIAALVTDCTIEVERETTKKLPAYDGHHIQVYVANFSRPHKRLLERNLITEESNQYQYRFVDITDLESGKPLFQIEHEVRCMTHPLYARPLVNRNPDVSNTRYAPGHEALAWSLPPSPDFAAAR